MKIYEITLTETYTNLLPGDDEKKLHYAEEVYAMLQRAYADIGGIMSKGFRNPEDMLNIPMWKIFRRGNDIKTVAMYKDTGGRKVAAVATDNSIDGKKHLAQMMKDDILRGRAFMEISDKFLVFLEKQLGKEVLYSMAIPTDQVIAYFEPKGQEIRPIDEYEYERLLHGGKWKKKIMIGTLGNTIR